MIIVNETEITYDDVLDTDAFDESTPHFERLQKLGLTDPIHTVPLHEFIQAQVKVFLCHRLFNELNNTYFPFQIGNIRQQLGEERYRALMLSIDPETLNNASLFLNLFIQIPDHNSNRLEASMD